MDYKAFYEVEQKRADKAEDALAAAIARAEAAECELAELRAANEWRPVTEKPEQDGDYLVCTYFGRCEIMLWSDGSWYSDSGNDGSVSHWRPLPPPPQGE